MVTWLQVRDTRAVVVCLFHFFGPQRRIKDLAKRFSTCIVVPRYKLGLRLTDSFLSVLT